MNRFYLPLLTLCLLLSLPACGSTLEGGDTRAGDACRSVQPLGGDLEGELPYGVPVDFDPPACRRPLPPPSGITAAQAFSRTAESRGKFPAGSHTRCWISTATAGRN